MIVFDIQAVQSAAFGGRGIGRYVADLARAITRHDPTLIDVFAWNDAWPDTPQLNELRDHPVIAERMRGFSELSGANVDVLHINAPFEMVDLASIAVPVRARRTVLTVFDLIPLRFPDVYLADPSARARYVGRLAQLNVADRIVTDSQSAAFDVETMLGIDPNRITVIGGDVGGQFVRPEGTLVDRFADLARSIVGLEPRYVFVPTGFDWRKNMAGAIAAFGRLPAALRQRHQLVITCAVDDRQRAWIEAQANDAGIADRTIITGHVPDAVLVLLYQCAELVLFPSFYEGFGLPVLEARRCGARVICSNTSSLPEVLPDERAWFDPWSLDDIATTLEQALNDPAVVAMLDAVPDAAMSWATSAEQVAAVYREVRPPAAARSDRRRVGVVTVLPPTASGIADHSERLLDALHATPGVDVSVFCDLPEAAVQQSEYPVHSIASLRQRWQRGELDTVLYCIGNNPIHRSAVMEMPFVPGHVLLHDVALDYLGWPGLADQVAERAISVLVQSEHAVQVAKERFGIEAIDVGPIPSAEVLPAQAVDDPGLPWVISAGIAHHTKASDVVAAAMGVLVAEGAARAAFVGDGGQHFVDPDSGIVATGPVDAGEYDHWLRRAAVAVQLRRTSNGESSGVAADAIARGLPLIVSDLGAMAELPEAVAERVAVDVTSDELASTIRQLLADANRLDEMGAAALAMAARETPTAQANRILDATK